MRVPGNVKCNRWYFKFNGNECSGPMTIEAIVYQDWSSGNPDLWHHQSFEGYCENIPQGAVRVDLWVGKCTGVTSNLLWMQNISLQLQGNPFSLRLPCIPSDCRLFPTSIIWSQSKGQAASRQDHC